MPTKRHKPEEIVTKLRQVDVLVPQGQGIVDAIRQIGVSEGYVLSLAPRVLLSLAPRVRRAQDRVSGAAEGS